MCSPYLCQGEKVYTTFTSEREMCTTFISKRECRHRIDFTDCKQESNNYEQQRIHHEQESNNCERKEAIANTKAKWLLRGAKQHGRSRFKILGSKKNHTQIISVLKYHRVTDLEGTVESCRHTARGKIIAGMSMQGMNQLK